MLTSKEINFLNTHGYLNLGQILSQNQVDKINGRIDELLDLEGDNAGAELFDSKYIRHPKEAGADRLADLVNKGEVFDIFYSNARVLAGIEAILGIDYKLSSLNYRAAKPGLGAQKLHVDWKDGVVSDGHYKVCNSIWLLDDFTSSNGPTRLVPGSHKWSILPDEMLEDPYDTHPEEITLLAPTGSVFIFNSHIWHGGTTNHTSRYRRSIHSYFCTSDQPQQIDQRKYITSETKNRIGLSGQKILDVL